jgi:hypothetical protein
LTTRADPSAPDSGVRGKGAGKKQSPSDLDFLPFIIQKATDSRKKPEEEEENQMAGRPGHWNSQTAVCDLVTAWDPGNSDHELLALGTHPLPDCTENISNHSPWPKDSAQEGSKGGWLGAVRGWLCRRELDFPSPKRQGSHW